MLLLLLLLLLFVFRFFVFGRGLVDPIFPVFFFFVACDACNSALCVLSCERFLLPKKERVDLLLIFPNLCFDFLTGIFTFISLRLLKETLDESLLAIFGRSDTDFVDEFIFLNSSFFLIRFKMKLFCLCVF